MDLTNQEEFESLLAIVARALNKMQNLIHELTLTHGSRNININLILNF
jgi:BMFP domain-containing protein YqiC